MVSATTSYGNVCNSCNPNYYDVSIDSCVSPSSCPYYTFDDATNLRCTTCKSDSGKYFLAGECFSSGSCAALGGEWNKFYILK